LVAGLGAVLGACLSSGVIDTARKGIFDPGMLSALENPLETALAIYIAVYIVDTILLYGYSAFGMPVSTTACLVFELLGASFAVGGSEIVKWPNAGKVVFAIVCSIFISGVAGFFIQRAIRGAIRDGCQQLKTLLLHGAWAGGGMLTMLVYFMIVKGMKNVGIVSSFNKEIVGEYGAVLVVFTMWALFAMAIHALLVMFKEKAAVRLFPWLAIVGTVCMGFAFGQNDLANCASPGLSAWTLIENREQGVELASKVAIEAWMLFGCGLLLFAGMTTKNAKRVTKNAISAGSMSHNVALYAPRWCIRAARYLIQFRGRQPTLAPSPVLPDTHEIRDYDPLRACVILGVSASVIATASSFKMPVSTTYVAFAAVIATGAADRILQRGDSDLKLARTIWVIFSWFAAAIVAAVAAGLVCKFISWLSLAGMIIAIALNLGLRSKRGEAQELRIREEARERQSPEEFAEYEG
jgi:phosphate/sulfate permease